MSRPGPFDGIDLGAVNAGERERVFVAWLDARLVDEARHPQWGRSWKTTDGPGAFDGIDRDTLTSWDRARVMDAWMRAKREAERAQLPPLRPGDISEVKMRDVLATAAAQGLPDYREQNRAALEEWRRRAAQRERGGSDAGSGV